MLIPEAVGAGPDLVSIIIPTWNRPDTAWIAIHTALHQSHTNVEVIVVDDGSEIPFDPGIRDNRLRIIRLEKHQGVAFARNVGMSAARGAYFSFLDDDDWYYPDKTLHQVAYLRENTELDGVFSRVVVIDGAGNQRRYLPDGYRHNCLQNFRYYNVVHTNSALLRRCVYPAVSWDERLTKYTDMQFFLEITRRFRLGYWNEDVATWYQQNRRDQVTSGPAPGRVARYRNNWKNFRLICDIFNKTIASSLELRICYYGRLFISSLKAGEWTCAVRCAVALATGHLERYRQKSTPQDNSCPGPAAASSFHSGS